MPNQDTMYAGFWLRVGASIIDSFLIALVAFPFLGWMYGEEYFALVPTVEANPAGEILMLWVLPAVAVVLFWVFRQATPGKMAIRARIVDAATGEPPSAGQCIGRYLAYFPATLCFGLGLLWVGFDARKQGWHDKLAGTVVIRRVGNPPPDANGPKHPRDP